jgi:hypothetical protein
MEGMSETELEDKTDNVKEEKKGDQRVIKSKKVRTKTG